MVTKFRLKNLKLKLNNEFSLNFSQGCSIASQIYLHSSRWVSQSQLPTFVSTIWTHWSRHPWWKEDRWKKLGGDCQTVKWGATVQSSLSDDKLDPLIGLDINDPEKCYATAPDHWSGQVDEEWNRHISAVRIANDRSKHLVQVDRSDCKSQDRNQRQVAQLFAQDQCVDRIEGQLRL